MPTKRRDPLLTVRDVAEQLNVHYLTALNLVAAGEFPNAVNIGGEGTRRRYRIPQGDVDGYLQSKKLTR